MPRRDAECTGAWMPAVEYYQSRYGCRSSLAGHSGKRFRHLDRAGLFGSKLARRPSLSHGDEVRLEEIARDLQKVSLLACLLPSGASEH